MQRKLIKIERFINEAGFYLYFSNDTCEVIAEPPTVDPLLEYIAEREKVNG